MARKSSIDTLPPDILEQLQALLRDPRCTQLDITARINAALEETGREDRISKSALNRYAVRMDKVGARLKQGREISQMWIGQLGNTPQGQLGQLINELIRNLAFEAALNFAEGEAPIPPKALKELAIAAERLEKAASENEKRDAEIKRRTLEEAATQAEQAATKVGVSPEGIAAIRAAISQRM
jgi:hypothetical protein